MIQEFDFTDLGGGLNEGEAWNDIMPNQATVLRNYYPFGKKLVKRGGTRKITTSAPWDQNAYSMFPFKVDVDTWALLLGGQDKFGRLDGNSVSDLTGPGITSGTGTWCFFQYQGYAYAMRESSGQLFRMDQYFWNTAGLAAPSTAPTIAQGAAGNLTAANYYAVVTFYNSTTGIESNPSPASSVLALAGSKTIDWSGIPVSANGFVTARRLYRTLPGQVGEYFFVGQINDNTTTTYSSENVIIADMGRAVSFNNGVPPAQLTVGVIWRERLFCTDGTDLFYSEYLLPECFGDESILSIYPDDGHVIRAVHAFGDRLIIGKTNKIHYLVGADRSSFNVLTLSDRHGCLSHHSMKSAEGQLFWYGSGNNFYRSDGNSVQEISSVALRSTLDNVPDNRVDQIVSEIYPSLGWYVTTLPQGAGNNSVVVVYNYKTNAWSIFDHPTDAPQFFCEFFDENLEQQLMATFYDGHVYQYQDASYFTDWGNPIECEYISGANDFGHPGYRKAIQEVWVNCPRVIGGTVDVSIYNDEDTTPIVADRSVSVDIASSAWKPFKLPVSGSPGTQIRFGIKQSDASAFELTALHYRVNQLARRPGQPR